MTGAAASRRTRRRDVAAAPSPAAEARLAARVVRGRPTQRRQNRGVNSTSTVSSSSRPSSMAAVQTQV